MATQKEGGRDLSQLGRELNPELEKACDRVQELLRRSDARDIVDRHAIGCIVRDVRSAEHAYGHGAVGKLARAVGRDVDTLYEYADVAETWSETEIVRLAERKSTLGVPLSFSHLVALSKVRRNRDLLKVMTERAFGGISVHHLRSLINEARQGKARSGADDEALEGFERAVKSLRRVAGSMRGVDASLQELGEASPTAKLQELLKRAAEANAQLADSCALRAARLQAELERVRGQLEEQAAAAGDETVVRLFADERAS